MGSDLAQAKKRKKLSKSRIGVLKKAGIKVFG
jgi:hypothetical protein